MLRFQVCLRSAHAGGLAVTFDHALGVLQSLPRMFIEPDGSFVWTGIDAGGQTWQVDGNLIDRGDVLAYVEVGGTCPPEQFDQLLGALGWPSAPLAFELTRKGTTLLETEFRKLAATPAGAV